MRKVIINTLLYFVIIFTVLQNMWWVTIIVLVIFAIRAKTWLLLPAAILIDGYFGAFNSIPVLSIATTVMVTATELLRPRILWKASSYE